MGTAKAVMQNARAIKASIDPCLRMKPMPSFMLARIDVLPAVGTNRGLTINKEMMGAKKRGRSIRNTMSDPGSPAPTRRRGPDDASDVELDGLQCNGVRHVLFVNQRGDERLIGWAAKSLSQAVDK